ncbi:hypothetical protein HYW21_01830, partial [Candidatus Woesearchaeota archaeon]|nr:hypothetical protein [Candidatus Woesearchaeota archaeon]
IVSANDVNLTNSSELQFTTSFEKVYIDANNAQQRDATVVIDGANVSMSIPVIYATLPEIITATVPKPKNWENGFAWYLQEGTVIKQITENNGNLSWTANLSQTNVWLYFSVPAPTLRIDGIWSNTTLYMKNFTVLAANRITNIGKKQICAIAFRLLLNRT